MEKATQRTADLRILVNPQRMRRKKRKRRKERKRRKKRKKRRKPG